MSRLIKHTIKIFAAFTLFFFAASSPASTDAGDDISALIESVDQNHQLFSAHFQTFLFAQPQWAPPKYKEINPLLLEVEKFISKNESILAASIILNNITVLSKYYDDRNITYFINILLNQNDTKTANTIFDLVKDEGDQTLISNTTYVFATFSFKRNKWKKTLQLLDGIINDLPDENYYHALLMQGISLQKLKKHRESIAHYEKIKPVSKHYLAARLNIAIANIRQGWWTDAHIIIKNALKSAESVKEEEALNRLYLTLGYSLMKQEFYRDSRNYFRSIGIDSVFANRALLGITLTAANQSDFVGALSTTNILKNKQTYDLPVDESYLLVPYFYEQLQQLTTASAGYLEAINYYQKRIADIQAILDSEINLNNHPINIGINTTIKINDNLVDFSHEYPDFFFENYLKLQSYEKHFKNNLNEKISAEYHQLSNEYKNTTVKIIRNILQKRIKHLDSYMNQSRFGLARLYDNNLADD